MKRIILLTLLLAVSTGYARLGKGDIGIGGEIGTLIDANVNWYVGNDRTVEGLISISNKWFLAGGGMRTYWLDLLDYDHDLYLTYNFRAYLFTSYRERSPFYKTGDTYRNAFGIAGVASIGVSFMPEDIPIEGYTDLGIGLSLMPETEMFPSWEVGLRVYPF